jgi:hypothetical protein
LYTFQLKEKDHIRILRVFHILIGLILLFDFLHSSREGNKDWLFSTVCIIAAGFLIIASLFAGKIGIDRERHLSLLLFESLVVSGGMIYFWSKDMPMVSVSHALLAGSIILFWIYLRQRKEGEKIIITDEGVLLPSLFGQRLVKWKELTNLIKREDMLTIDFKNNKIIQTEINHSENIEDRSFNEFCQRKLDQASAL